MNCVQEQTVRATPLFLTIVMDYAFCYSDQFTFQQRKRIRHILSYSPLIPGTKEYTSADTRSLSCDEQPPIQFRY